MSDFVGLALGVLFLPLVISLFMIYLLASAVLYVGIWTFWIPRGRRVLFVYSNSPVWKEYIEQEILPRLPAESLVMNYSERARWRRVSFGTLVYCISQVVKNTIRSVLCFVHCDAVECFDSGVLSVSSSMANPKL